MICIGVEHCWTQSSPSSSFLRQELYGSQLKVNGESLQYILYIFSIYYSVYIYSVYQSDIHWKLSVQPCGDFRYSHFNNHTSDKTRVVT